MKRLTNGFATAALRTLRAQGGGIAVWTAASLLPLTALVGAAVDFQRLGSMQTAAQDATDAAILEASRVYLAADEGDPQRLPRARAAAGGALAANLGGAALQLKDLQWDLVPDPDGTGELVLNTRARAPLAFGGLLGLADMPVEASAASVVAVRLEVALVLDTTGSMNENNKLGILKTSTDRLIDQLDAAAKQNPAKNPLKLALVPYSNTVRLPKAYAKAAWMDGWAKGNGYWNDAPRPEPFDRFDAYGPGGWGGCVESRPMPHDVSAAPPNSAVPDTFYVPFFNPDAPDPNAGCSISEVVRLTHATGKVKAAVKHMDAAGATNIPLGLLWGWHALQPSRGPFGPGNAETPHPTLVKAVVLVTDGQNDLGGKGYNGYTGVGRVDQKRVGVGVASTREERTAALDRRLAALCANMKAEGIVIYAVRVEVESGSDATLKACATRPEAPFYNDVRNADQLPAVFSKVGEGLIRVRLSR